MWQIAVSQWITPFSAPDLNLLLDEDEADYVSSLDCWMKHAAMS